MAVWPSRKFFLSVPHSMVPGGHHAVDGAEVVPELQRLLGGRRVEVGHVAVAVHQHLVVLHGQRAEHPVGIPGRRNHHSPALDLLTALADKLLPGRDQIVPGRRRVLGIESGFPEGILVVVHDDGGALERDAPGLAPGHAVLHQRRVEGREPRPLVIRLDDVVEGDDGVLLDQLVDVDREHDRQLGRLTALQRREGLDARVVVVAGVDCLDLDVRILAHEVRDQAVHDLGQRAADGDGVVHRQLHRLRDRREQQSRGQHQRRGQGRLQCLQHRASPFRFSGSRVFVKPRWTGDAPRSFAHRFRRRTSAPRVVASEDGSGRPPEAYGDPGPESAPTATPRAR